MLVLATVLISGNQHVAVMEVSAVVAVAATIAALKIDTGVKGKGI